MNIKRLLFFIPAAFFLSCAAEKGPLHLHPAGYNGTGYYQSGEKSSFENKSLKVTLRHITRLSETERDPLMLELFAKNFIFLRLDIENRSSLEVTYDPSHTSLVSGSFGYEKPVDYTELYHIVSEKYEGGLPERRLSSLKGKFYDLATKVPPGGKASKFLIFYPFEKDSKGEDAALTINELYMGVDTVSLSFPFKIKAVEGGARGY
ncbi:MAG: hypothetical protein HY883_02665 [Deltaproteobacteria bacterium]|nr:hypothetical protein [Deltaproteobacteria bacterium]